MARSASAARRGGGDLVDRATAPLERVVEVAAETQAEDPAALLLHGLEIADRLRVLQHAEGEPLTGNREIFGGVRGQQEKHARVRAALVELSGGMEVSRP